jgi:hypothetical protein
MEDRNRAASPLVSSTTASANTRAKANCLAINGRPAATSNDRTGRSTQLNRRARHKPASQVATGRQLASLRTLVSR